MVMWRLKSCPRCQGDLFIADDMEGGQYEQCLQCAYQRPIKKEVETKPMVWPRERRPKRKVAKTVPVT